MKKRNTLEVIRKYYLNEKHNIVILLIMFYLCLLYLMVLFPPIERILDGIGNFFTIMGISVITIISSIFVGNRIEKQYDKYFFSKCDRKIKKEPFNVPRKYYLNILEKNKGCFFVIGESGIGKSSLMNQLKERVSKVSTCDFVKNNYFNCLQQISNANYIIFDQFEKILDLSEPYTIIESIKKLDDGRRTLIFSLRKEYFAEIYKLFNYHGKLLWMEFKALEKYEIISQLLNLIGDQNILDTINIKDFSDEQIDEIIDKNIIKNDKQIKLNLLRQIAKDVKENNILFIQLTYLGRILQQNDNGIQQAELEWRDSKDYKNLIMHYIEKEIDQFKYSEVAYLILFLLCQDTKGIYANMYDDFGNISMQTNDVLELTVDYLEELKLILPIKSDNNQRGKYVSQYEIAHSYIQDILLTLCNNKLDIGIRNNIMFYNREYQIKRNEYSVQEEYPKKKISEKRDKYIKRGKYLFVSLSIMLIIITLWNIYYKNCLLNLSDYANKSFVMIFTNIAATVSTYYIFNYYHYFMRVFGYKYWPGVGVAMIAVVLSYAFPNYWAMGYGVAILVTGGVMYWVACDTRISEKSFFVTRCRNFVGIGIIVIVISYFYRDYTHGEMFLGWPCYVLYSGYMLLGTMGHINRPYILALLGKVLYNERKEDFK